MDRGCYGGPVENKDFKKPAKKSNEQRITELENRIERLEEALTRHVNPDY